MIALSIQLALFVVIIEAALWFIPKAVRRASQANCLRPNGTRSRNRAWLERQAYIHLRMELAPALFLIFLSGNALYQTIDNTVAPIPSVLQRLTLSIVRPAAATLPANTLSTGALIRVVTLSLLWLVISLAVAAWSFVVASRKFETGVRERSSGYLQFDVARSADVSTTGKSPKSAQPKGTDVA